MSAMNAEAKRRAKKETTFQKNLKSFGDAVGAASKKGGRKGFAKAGFIGSHAESYVATSKASKKYIKDHESQFSTTKKGKRYLTGDLSVDPNFFGHSKVKKQNIIKNPPKQPKQLGKDKFYGNVKNSIGKR